MSLKAFHVFFVAIAILMCISLGIWGIRSAGSDVSSLPMAMGAAGFAGALILVIYGAWMLKKLKRFSYV
ncbi:MAG: hypothetical protein H6819_08060 [Phycisphaerales bacterium]|nr:hypothetical protein [Phycisphaerales bacterium]MCB9854270.1 hypothetical protein [Phycisphaerales bacterium]